MKDFNFEKELERRRAEREATQTRQFTKVYEDILTKLTELTGAELKLILYLGLRMDYKKSRIILDDEFYLKLEAELDINKNYFGKLCKRLKEKGFLYKGKVYLYLTEKYISRKR